MALKITSGKSGETRRWGSKIWEQNASELRRALCSTFPELFTNSREDYVMTYVDPDGDDLFITEQNVAYEFTEDVLCFDKNKDARVVVHESKDAAKAYLAKKKGAPLQEKFDVKALGPRPMQCVAVDLGIPMPEARELTQRAMRGDEIARRVVGPSAGFWAKLVAENSQHILLESTKFHEAHRAALVEKGKIGTQRTVLEAHRQRADAFRARMRCEAPVHYGVTCDVTGMNPIVGTRWKLKGENYDLCDAAFQKLSPEEQNNFIKILAPRNRGFCHRGFPAAQPQQQQQQQQHTSQQDTTNMETATTAPTTTAPTAPAPTTAPAATAPAPTTAPAATAPAPTPPAAVVESVTQDLPPFQNVMPEPSAESDDELVVVSAPPPSYETATDQDLDHALGVSLLASMGFQDDQASNMLKRHGSVEKAVESFIQDTNKQT